MEHEPPVIVPCPPDLRREALSLVLCDVSPSQRHEIAGALWNTEKAALSPHGLYVAVRDCQIRGAAWVQCQPGKTSVFWPPQLAIGEDQRTAFTLAEAVLRELDGLDVSMAQVLLPADEGTHVAVLTEVGFRHLADLLYLSCEADRFSTSPTRGQLSFAAYDDAQHTRFQRLVEQTYENTRDCAALNGVRRMEDVLDGYRSTGTFLADHWLAVCHSGQDVGVLLLAEHSPANFWELMYMGLIPAARGRGWGREIVQHAQLLAHRAGVERIVLAVDAANAPALQMYRSAGFEAWDRRAVYVRIPR